MWAGIVPTKIFGFNWIAKWRIRPVSPPMEQVLRCALSHLIWAGTIGVIINKTLDGEGQHPPNFKIQMKWRANY